MKTIKSIAATLVLAATPALFAEEDKPVMIELHQKVFDTVKQVRDVLVPAPAIHFVETFPPVAIPRQRILRLAQVDPASGKPGRPGAIPVEPPDPPPPPVGAAEAAAMADWATGLAVATSENALRTLFPVKTRNKALVVTTGSHDAKAAAQLDEDMNVMMRILEKSANTRDEGKAMGIDVFAFAGSSSPRVFYLEGYGALFILKVKHPLIAPPRPANEPEKAQATSSEWENARQEIYGRPAGEGRPGAAEQFDPARVEELKKHLIEDLANATHIRNLKNDDLVTVVVMGGGARGEGGRKEVRAGRASAGGGSGGSIYVAGHGSGEGSQTTMTLRAKKADIDAFAKKEINAEEFGKKVSVQVY